MLARRRKPGSRAQSALPAREGPPGRPKPTCLPLPARISDASAATSRVRRTLSGESGLSLIEVTISALLVGVIAVGVLTGFEAAARSANNNRLHDEATLLASESQEELRTDPSSALSRLAASPHTYKRTVGKEGFTIVQEAKFNKQPTDAGCGSTAGAKSGQEPSENYEIRSRVTWTQNKRAEIEQSSIITPPEGSALDVEVNNGGATPETTIPVAGASVEADGIPTTTSEEGCAIYTGLSDTSVSVAVSKSGYVTPSGEPQFTQESVTIAPNIITRLEVLLGEAGAIAASFSYKGAPEYNGAQVTGDTFVAYNSAMGTSTNYVLAGTNGSYETHVTSEEKLFPFPETKSWQVYAGDCPADSPTSVTGGKITPPEVVVIGGQMKEVTVPMSKVQLEVYEGTSAEKGKRTNELLPVTITNSGCAGQMPSGVTDESQQKLNGNGELQHPFQPFGSFKLCLYSSVKKQTYTTEKAYTNSSEAGSSLKIYLGGQNGSAGSGIAVRRYQSSC